MKSRLFLSLSLLVFSFFIVFFSDCAPANRSETILLNQKLTDIPGEDRQKFHQPLVKEVEFETFDGVKLSGQLDYHATDKKLPLIFFLQGYGHQDRDGCSLEFGDLYNVKFMAEVLQLEGIAFFRMDKRGVNKSGGEYIEDNEVLIKDFLAGYKAAVALPEIDPERVIIMPQSHGSVIFGHNFQLFNEVNRPVAVLLISNGVQDWYVNDIDVPIHIMVGNEDWNPLGKVALAPIAAHNRRYGFNDTYYIAHYADHGLFDSRFGNFVKNGGGPGPYVMNPDAVEHLIQWCKEQLELTEVIISPTPAELAVWEIISVPQ